MTWPAGLSRSDDIAVEHLRYGATVHRPYGCPAAELIEGPYMGAYRVEHFEARWCWRCFPDQAPRPLGRLFYPILSEVPHAA